MERGFGVPADDGVEEVEGGGGRWGVGGGLGVEAIDGGVVASDPEGIGSICGGVVEPYVS